MGDESIWKKEIRLRKKSAPPAPQPPAATPPGDRPTSIWKRELHFHKPVEFAVPVIPQPQPAPVPGEPNQEPRTRFEPVPTWDAPDPQAPFDLPVAEVAPVVHGEATAPAAADQVIASPVVEDEVAPPVVEHEVAPPVVVHEALLPVVLSEVTPDDVFVPPVVQHEVVPPLVHQEVEPPVVAEHLVEHVVESNLPAPAVTPAASESRLSPMAAPDADSEHPDDHVEEAPALQALPEENTEAHETSPVEPEVPLLPAVAVLEPGPEPTSGEAAKKSALKRDVKLPRLRRRKTKAVAAATAAVVASEPETPAAPKPSLLKRDLKLAKPGRTKDKSPASAAGAHAAKKIVGLRIGSSQIAAALIHNNGSAELLQLARAPIPHGIVSGGEVRDVESLTRELKNFFGQNKLPRKGVRLGIASNRIGVRVLEVPKLDDPKLFDNSIRFHAQETLPIAVNDANLDYIVIGEGAGQGLEPTVRVLLVFAHRELVERHVEACRRAGIKLEGVDFEAFALLRALSAPLPDDADPTEAVVAVAVGNERTIFAVSDGRTCDFTRVLEWGGGSLDVALARALNLTPSQAEPIKLALALDGEAAPSQLAPEQAEAARVAIRTEMQTLSRELVSSLQFYQSRSGSHDIGAILLSGGGAHLAGFAEELERSIGVPVRLGDPLGRVELPRKMARPAEAGSLAVAIGLGIED
jgi:type IV pilus assembly protein PilM